MNERAISYDKDRLLLRARTYLGAGRAKDTAELDSDICKAADDLYELDSFRFCHEEFSLIKEDTEEGFFVISEPDIRLPSRDLLKYFDGCTGISVSACTLGIETEKLIKRLQHTDLKYSAVVDAVAGALLECMMDEAEKLYLTSPRTFRFAPGYGDLPLDINISLAGSVNMTKRIGVSLTGSGLLIPQKSMIGITGLGSSAAERDCGSCTNLENCGIRKEGLRCWI